jgi:leucyl/phenylalanyl-tRNA--protein transferase
MPIFLLSDSLRFPPPHLASKEGLLAMGGDLTRERLLSAYRKGIFPWYSEGEPLLWWSPDPRLVLYPKELKISHSLKKTIRRQKFSLTIDTAFMAVIKACARVHLKDQKGTWITDDMIHAYCDLHKAGYAHSVEAWYDGDLAGGLYGISLGRCFYGESMFTRVSDASKVAFVKLVEVLIDQSCHIIDCQVKTDHLIRFGAREIPRKRFLQQLEKSLKHPTIRGKWGKMKSSEDLTGFTG